MNLISRLLRGWGAQRPSARQLRETQSEIDRAKADFEAACKLWPRDRKAVTAAFVRLRNLRSAQLAREVFG